MAFLPVLVDALLDLGNTMPIYAGFGPETLPDAYTTIIPIRGPASSIETPMRKMLAQVNVFSQVLQTAEEQAALLRDALHGKANWSISGYTICFMRVQHEPYLFAYAAGYYRYTFTVQIDFVAEWSA